jgi:DNA-binding MarR family transcriptional regulator
MTSIPAAYAEFGQTLAFTERAMTRVLRQHLATRSVEPETWYALKLIASQGPGISRAAVARDLAGTRGSDDQRARALLARLEREGLISGEGTLSVTAEGAALFGALREHVLGATVTFLSQFDLDDIETTVRTLRAISERADKEAESPV